MVKRMTRSPSRLLDQDEQETARAAPGRAASEIEDHEGRNPNVAALPTVLPRRLTGLSEREYRLLQFKQDKLSALQKCVPERLHYANQILSAKMTPALEAAVQATLIFAQEEAGTAVCISPEGLLLTCSHCVAETQEEAGAGKQHWLLFADGRAVRATCVTWDGVRDLALLRIVASQTQAQATSDAGYPFVQFSDKAPPRNAKLICVGQPGSEDFEVARAGVATGYDVLHVCEGRYRGLAKGQDVHDNSEIGALMHDCWTYWGHSGAPLLRQDDGKLVGLHSSWDDATGMRRGVALEAIKAFLDGHEERAADHESTNA